MNPDKAPLPTICEALQTHAQQQSDATAFTYLTDGEAQTESLTFRELAQKSAKIAVHLREKIPASSRALIVLEPGLDFVTALFACFQAGIVAVPTPLPAFRIQSKSAQRFASLVKDARPDIILTHSPSDYMSDHENTSRLAVSAAFARGMPNFESDPPVNANGKDVSLYHAMPHGLRDPLRQRIRAELYADTSSVHSIKRQALAAHVSQKAWLDETQGMDSYLVDMDRMSQEIGKLSEKFEYAEGWRRHLHLGFSTTDQDPLREALSDCSRVDEIYQQGLESPS